MPDLEHEAKLYETSSNYKHFTDRVLVDRFDGPQ